MFVFFIVLTLSNKATLIRINSCKCLSYFWLDEMHYFKSFLLGLTSLSSWRASHSLENSLKSIRKFPSRSAALIRAFASASAISPPTLAMRFFSSSAQILPSPSASNNLNAWRTIRVEVYIEILHNLLDEQNNGQGRLRRLKKRFKDKRKQRSLSHCG